MVRKKQVRRGIIFFVLLAFLVPSVGFMVHSGVLFLKKVLLSPSFLGPEKVVINFSNIYSSSLQLDLVNFVKRYISQKNIFILRPEELSKELRLKFNVVKFVESYIKNPEKSIYLTIGGVVPLCVVNNALIVGDSKEFFDIKLFEKYQLQQIPHVTVAVDLCSAEREHAVCEILSKISKNIWETFDVDYKKISYILLSPKQPGCKYILVANEESMFNEKKLAATKIVFDDLSKRGLLAKSVLESKCTDKILFDVRFKGRIVARVNGPLKKGGGYGKKIT
jgi:hypothetical protein